MLPSGAGRGGARRERRGEIASSSSECPLLGPIFNREFFTIPRRSKHYVTRSMYLFVLWVLALTAWQATFGWGRQNSQGDLAFFGTLVFQLLSFLQLVLVIFFSALFSASAVTQEKDRRTFVLLLMTDLKNYEIVLGKLFGSLLQVGILVLCAMPLLALTMLLGGVAFEQIILTFLVLVCTGIAAASLGSLLALWRDKTFQALALTVLALVLYLLLVEALGGLPDLFRWIGGEGSFLTGEVGRQIAEWRTRLNPFRALQSVVEPATAESLLWAPAHEYAGLMLILSVLLTGLAMWKLRKWNPSGEPIQQKEGHADQEAELHAEKRSDIHAAPGRLREVWTNPVLWREIRTRGYGARPVIVKIAYLIVIGLICFWAYKALPEPGTGDRLAPARGLVPITVLSLLLLNAQAVTSITSERDLKALELLLVTDVTPKEFIFGKLGGIFYNTKEIVLPPLILAIAYASLGYMGAENFLFIFISLVVLLVFTAVLGLHVSLRTENTRLSIGYSLGTVFFLFVGTFICIYLILVSSRFESQWTSFLFFLAVGIGGLFLVLAGNKPSAALFIAAWSCPLGMFYMVTGVLVGNPQTGQAGDPLWPFLVLAGAFGFTVAAMLVPMLSEFDVALSASIPAVEE